MSHPEASIQERAARPSIVFHLGDLVTHDTGLPAPVGSIIGTYSRRLSFWLNGRPVEIDAPDPALTLSDYLLAIGLTGTKVGCAQGGCGACTVMISRRVAIDNGNGVADADADADASADHRAINACLRPLVSVAATHVTSVEGIGNVHDGLDPVQHRIALENGSQCGFCTPGFVMNAHAFLRQHPGPSAQQVGGSFRW